MMGHSIVLIIRHELTTTAKEDFGQTTYCFLSLLPFLSPGLSTFLALVPAVLLLALRCHEQEVQFLYQQALSTTIIHHLMYRKLPERLGCLQL